MRVTDGGRTGQAPGGSAGEGEGRTVRQVGGGQRAEDGRQERERRKQEGERLNVHLFTFSL